jgi:hypothetical protein
MDEGDRDAQRDERDDAVRRDPVVTELQEERVHAAVPKKRG